MESGDHEAAARLLADAQGLIKDTPDGRVRAQVLYLTGEASLAVGEPAQAVIMFGRALTIVRDLGDPVGQAHIRRGLGLARLRLGEFGAARTELERALDLAGRRPADSAPAQAPQSKDVFLGGCNAT
jgi:Flp pilus assembly protein TadD